MCSEQRPDFISFCYHVLSRLFKTVFKLFSLRRRGIFSTCKGTIDPSVYLIRSQFWRYVVFSLGRKDIKYCDGNLKNVLVALAVRQVKLSRKSFLLWCSGEVV